MVCIECGDRADIKVLNPESVGALETFRFLYLSCRRCGFESTSHRVCDLLITKLLKLTTRSRPLDEQPENELLVKIEEMKDLIKSLRPLVANTSFALGIMYRELADIYETLGRMDKCVDFYKRMIPIVE